MASKNYLGFVTDRLPDSAELLSYADLSSSAIHSQSNQPCFHCSSMDFSMSNDIRFITFSGWLHHYGIPHPTVQFWDQLRV